MDERTEGQLRVIRKVIAVTQAADIPAWLFGGWGLDARIGRITREHGDVELWVERIHAERSKAVLVGAGATALTTQPPEEACEFTWDDVPLSTAYFDRQPDGSFSQPLGRWSDWLFPPGSFGDEPGPLDGTPVLVKRARDGTTWRIGTDAEVAWIANGTSPGRTITAAIPPLFEAYATVPLGYGEERDVHDRALLTLLREQSPGQRWWLGYLDTGVDDIVFPDAPKVTLHYGWRYVLVAAGPDQAAAWRPDGGRAFGTGDLPNLMFPLTAPGWCLRCGTTTGAASADRPGSWTGSCAILICRRGRWPLARTLRHQVMRCGNRPPSVPPICPDGCQHPQPPSSAHAKPLATQHARALCHLAA